MKNRYGFACAGKISAVAPPSLPLTTLLSVVETLTTTTKVLSACCRNVILVQRIFFYLNTRSFIVTVALLFLYSLLVISVNYKHRLLEKSFRS